MPPANRQNPNSLEYADKEKNICHLLFTENSGSITLTSPIQSQTIRVVGTRIIFNSNTFSAQNPLVYLQMTPFGPQQTNSNIGISAIPIFCDSTVDDYTSDVSYSLTLSGPFPQRFTYRITDENAVLIPNSALYSLQVIFEYEIDWVR